MNQSSSSNTVLESNLNPYITLNNQGIILPGMELSASEHRLGRDPTMVDLVVPNDWNIVSRCQGLFIREDNHNYRLFDGNGARRSSNGLFINNKLIPLHGHLLSNGDRIQIGQNPRDWVIIEYHSSQVHSGFTPPKTQSISLLEKPIILGRDENADLRLEAPTVSRKHAVITKNSKGDYILTDYSANGVFVNEKKVNGSCVISHNSLITIGPYRLVLQGHKLVIADPGDNIRLDAFNLIRVVKDQEGKDRTIINDISLPIEPGQFVALVGGSGAGKSTLMGTLLGIQPTTQGAVFINGEDLRQNFNIYRNQIGYVPQKDIIHKDLTVIEALEYSAKLRLPPDINIREIVSKTLDQIELVDYKNILVKNLSGGQLKRVSIGVELLADPKLFFLDEPTSGLDPGLDKKMMELLRKLADEGRTIILVTHATTNISMCDRLVFLGRGGHLCYYGEPQKAMDFFNISSGNFADIYINLETIEAVINKAQEFKNSSYYQDNIKDHLSQKHTTYSMANNTGYNFTNTSLKGNKIPYQSTPEKVKPSLLKQTITLTQRYGKIIFRDKINLLISLLTAPIGISLISFAIKIEPFTIESDNNPKLASTALSVLFVFTCANIWVGLSGALQEIVKEADIYFRERLVNLDIFAYLFSKLSVLKLVTFLQSLLIVLTILIRFASPNSELIPWSMGVFITSFLTIFASINFALMVSAGVKNITQANSLLPLLLIPQIIFSGVLFTMEDAGKYLSWLTISRWSVGAYGTLVDVNAMIPEPIILPDGSAIAPGIPESLVYDSTWHNLAINWLVLMLHTLIYFAITFILQRRKDIYG
ncbi:ATP-binding cassette domain-containing protein [Cyanobacterium stanieri LEGE 03274]|uniref:ATP-binding cassette domain-containing protein n=1 Tax=Cyanobacterium stanieri LEGE 03274 TaxID=1828756 RepID=A0ABR9V0M6_9CHRO|nr:ATP-binding cassette domain-containing protein [Cyanobacterium stanieri]MBE9221432.1 ATP-binding cassette domain-containing protein [Cyanobacterium stanieri LEGE 03274]